MKFNLLNALNTYQPIDDNDKNNLENLISFLNTNNNCFDRKDFDGHITAGALIMDNNSNVLINHHKDINSWLLFGGHSDGNCDSLAVAKREVEEESGITEYECNGRILDIDIHIVPENTQKNEPAHRHYDIRFLFFVNNNYYKLSNESIEAKWVTIDEAKVLMKDADKIRLLDKAYQEYLKYKKHIL